MQINLKNHRANIFEKNPYDEKKVSIVFVPGAGMDHRIISMFDLEALYEEYNILGIDLPGHGYTSGPIVDSIRDHTNFCIDVFKEINIKKPIVIGHSWGGLVALDLSTEFQNGMTICMNIAYPFLVGDMLLDYAKGNLDQAVEFLMKYGIYKFPKTEIKTKGFGTMGSGFYGRSKGQIKSPYGTKIVEDDPEREIKLYPLKRLFNQSEKEISSIDLKSCNVFRLTDEQISNLENIKYIFSEKDKLARFNPDNVLLKNVDHEKDIVHLEDVGHFPYFEDKQLISETLVKLINS
jgi:pimeloyl-ACP methyl ester carboxylesterase|tara:strand:+ start:209 stop:1084 length:876 start_codon:yes stop_codon:yes gene_type:complete